MNCQLTTRLSLLLLLAVINAPVLASNDSTIIQALDTITLKETTNEAAKHTNSLIDAGQFYLSLALGDRYIEKFRGTYDANLVHLLLYLSYTSRALERDDLARAYLDSARHHLHRLGYPAKSQARYLVEMVQYMRPINTDSTLVYLEKLHTFSEETNNYFGLIGAAYNYALVYQRAYNNYDTAAMYLVQALKLAEEQQDTSWQIRVLHAFTYVYWGIDDYQKATGVLNKAEKLCINSRFKDYIDVIYEDQMRVYNIRELADSANYYAKKSWDISYKNGHATSLVKATLVLVDNFTENGQYDSAMKYARLAERALLESSKSKKAYREIDRYLFRVYQRMAEVNIRTERFNAAESLLLKASEYIDSTDATIYYSLLVLNKKLSFVSKQLGNHDKAYDYMAQSLTYAEKRMDWRDSLRTVIASEHAAELEKQYQTSKKQQQITTLEHQNEQQAAQNALLLVLTIASIVLIVVGVYAYRKIRSKNRQLGHAGKKLTESNNTKDKLISMVSHDLRRPMENLEVLLSLLEGHDTRELVQQNPEFLTDAKDEFKATNAMLRDLLFWVLLQRDQMALQPEWIDLTKLVEEQLNFVQPVVKSKEQTVSVQTGAYQVRTDQDMLRFILRNLFSNAVQYTPEKGQVTISASLGASVFRILVQDTGIGMDQETLKRLFEVKFNRSALERGSRSGAGVGLSLCADIAKRMGATIYAESSLNEGSVFVLELPAILVKEVVVEQEEYSPTL